MVCKPFTFPARVATAVAAGLMLCCAATVAQAQPTQGVSKDEIIIGTIQDLSGPVAAYGKAARNGIQLRVDEINEQGGINGRKIKLIVEDNAYDPKRAVLAAQKLVNQDKVFLIASHIGTPMNNAAMPVMFEKGARCTTRLTSSSSRASLRITRRCA
jgi:branched-chain amino acid transport system substrate-binding protein